MALRSAASLADAYVAWGLRAETIVVDDGGGGFQNVADLPPGAQLIRFAQNRGKGAAVRAGIAASRGAAVAYTDVDLPFGIEAIRHGARLVQQRGFHVVLGDRRLPHSSFAQPRSPLRRALSEVSAIAVGSFLTGGFFDTQCGLKVLNGRVARTLFERFEVDGFAFDVELVHTALALGLDIKRLAVHQEADGPSSVRVFRHTAEALRDLVRIRVRGRHTRRRFQDLVEQLQQELD